MGKIPSEQMVASWRRAVCAVSIRCAGNHCLQRSAAVVILARLNGFAPVWCTGFRTEPFLAHAWVEVNGVPIGEPPTIASYSKVLSTAPAYTSTTPVK